MLLPLVINLAGLSVAVLSDKYVSKKHRIVMFAAVLVVFSLIVQNTVDYVLVNSEPMPLLRTINSIYGYAARPVMIVLSLYIVAPKRRYTAAWIAAAVNAAVYMTALFSPVCFWLDSAYIHRKGPLGYTAHIIGAALLIYLLYVTVREYGHSAKREMIIPASIIILILISIIADNEVGMQPQMISYLTIAMVSACVFYYIWLHQQFVRRHEKALLAEQRIQIIMSQIQPHFLYNTLSTMQSLCLTDPQKAFDTIVKFGKYLRVNIDSLSSPALIPIEKELEHTRIYSEIEMLRFSNIRVGYDIEDTGFSVPALTVQPLVENAIRHGVRIREDGIVTVSTREKPDGHEIIIKDNGQGFDTSTLASTDYPAEDEDVETTESPISQHIGIRNVRERIEKMCGGTLSIESVVGDGTIIVITIPKK